jgi:hypothetical protein
VSAGLGAHNSAPVRPGAVRLGRLPHDGAGGAAARLRIGGVVRSRGRRRRRRRSRQTHALSRDPGTANGPRLQDEGRLVEKAPDYFSALLPLNVIASAPPPVPLPVPGTAEEVIANVRVAWAMASAICSRTTGSMFVMSSHSAW